MNSKLSANLLLTCVTLLLCYLFAAIYYQSLYIGDWFNHSLSTEKTSPWIKYSNDLTKYQAIIDSKTVFEGKKSVRLLSKSASPEDQISYFQRFDHTPLGNKKYRISAQVKVNKLSHPLSFMLKLHHKKRFQNSVYFERTLNPEEISNHWQEISFIAEFKGNDIRNAMLAFSTQGEIDLWIDHITLTPVEDDTPSISYSKKHDPEFIKQYYDTIGISAQANALRPRDMSFASQTFNQTKGWQVSQYVADAYDLNFENQDCPSAPCFSISQKPDIKNTNQIGVIYQRLKADNYRGKTVKLSGQLMLQKLKDRGTLWLRAMKGDETIAFDNMSDTSTRINSKWHPVSLELNIPPSADVITFGTLMSSKGTMLVDDITLEIIGVHQQTSHINIHAVDNTISNLSFEW